MKWNHLLLGLNGHHKYINIASTSQGNCEEITLTLSSEFSSIYITTWLFRNIGKIKVKVNMNLAALGYLQVTTEACIQIEFFNVGLKKFNSIITYYILVK